VLEADTATEIHIMRSDTVRSVEVVWRPARGREQRWSWTPEKTPDSGEPRLRSAIMPIDRGTYLPLDYEYDPIGERFRSLGYVRVGPVTVTSVEHAAADTTAGRNEFLTKVLTSLLIPGRRCRRILRKTAHRGG
jgi:hypothetical protein